MSAATGKVKKLLQAFRKAFKAYEKNPKSNSLKVKCEDSLASIKIAMLDFDIEGTLETDAKSAKEQIILLREALELASFLSVMTEDMKSFERHVSQVMVIYRDYSGLVIESPRKGTILGLNLMCLLAQNKLSEFHTELELIPEEARQDVYVSFPVEVEQRLMEGSYSKVLGAQKSVPSAHYSTFMRMLVATVKERISEVSSKAYESTGEEGKIGLKSREFVHESLGYATELERIV